MADPRHQEDITVEFRIGLDTVIGQHYTQTGPDDYSTEPMTFADAVVERAALMLVKQLIVDREGYSSLRSRAEAVIDTIVREKVEPIVVALIDGETPITNQFGEPTGSTITMRERIEKAGTVLLTKSSDPYARGGGKSLIDKIADEAAERALTKDLSAAVAEAKATLLATLTQNAASVMTKAISDAISGR